MSMRGLVLVCGLVSSAAMAQNPAGELKPASQWAVEFNENECVATRRFSNGEQSLVVGLRPVPASLEANLVLIPERPSAELERAELKVGELRLGEQGLGRGLVPVGVNAKGQRVYARRLKTDEYGRLATSGRLSISAGKFAADVKIGSIASVQSILDQCSLDLLKSLGFGPEVHKLQVHARGESDPRGVFRADDYPSEAQRAGATGNIEAIVVVGTDGRAKECRILRHGQHPSLGEATCKILLRRPRYIAARDARGAPIEAPLFIDVRWQLFTD